VKINGRLDVPDDAIRDFCKKWRITELALFGSVLRDDFGPESDVDVLVSFDPDACWGLLDLSSMEADLAAIVGRRVDIVTRRAVEESENYIRRRRILGSAKTIYATG
jgi:predicted nucleotidyltransferase